MRGKAAESKPTSAAASDNGNGTQDKPITVDMQLESIRGDLATAMIGELRGTAATWWEAQSEKTQQQAIDRAQSLSRALVERIARLVLTDGKPSYAVLLDEVTRNEKGYKCKFGIIGSKAAGRGLTDLVGSELALIPIPLVTYMGQRAPLEPDNIGDLAMRPGQPTNGGEERTTGL